MTEPVVTRAEHKELSQKKKTQARLSTAAGTLGLGAFGALAGSKALPKIGQGLARTGRNINQAKWDKAAGKLGRGALETGTVSGGVGAASSLNFAALSRKEGKKEEALAQGKNPNNPKIKKSIKRKGMNNGYALSKSLSKIAKAEEMPSNKAWNLAGKNKKGWESHVSDSAMKGYESLAPYRQEAKKEKRKSLLGYGGAAGASVAGLGAHDVLRGRTPKVIHRYGVPLAAGAAATSSLLAGERHRNRAEGLDLNSRKIRARGWQRKLNTDEVEKAFRLRTPGGFSRGTVVNPVGKKKAYTRRGYLTRTGR